MCLDRQQRMSSLLSPEATGPPQSGAHFSREDPRAHMSHEEGAATGRGTVRGVTSRPALEGLGRPSQRMSQWPVRRIGRQERHLCSE